MNPSTRALIKTISDFKEILELVLIIASVTLPIGSIIGGLYLTILMTYRMFNTDDIRYGYVGFLAMLYSFYGMVISAWYFYDHKVWIGERLVSFSIFFVRDRNIIPCFIMNFSGLMAIGVLFLMIFSAFSIRTKYLKNLEESE